jgi:hypothetical protein
MRALLDGCLSILRTIYDLTAVTAGVIFLCVMMVLVWLTTDDKRSDP